MTLDNIITLITFISSAVALYFAIKKQGHEEANVDADTITKLYDLIDKQEKRYQCLKDEFDAYKVKTTEQISDIASENVKLRKWAKKLMAQLERAGIKPVPYEE